MSRFVRMPILAAVIALFGDATLAGPVEDGNAGIAAMDRGAYDEAIRLFSRAIAAPSMSSGDREFAYLSRGKAYQAKGDTTHAAADFKEALRLSPDDADAAAALRTASASPGASLPVRPATAASGKDPWGLLGRMVGKYYWYQVPTQDPYAAYSFCEWIEPQAALSCLIRNRKGVVAVSETKLDIASGKLLGANMAGKTVYYDTAVATDTMVQGFSYYANKPHRTVQTVDNGTGFKIVSDIFADGWRPDATVHLVETTEDDLIAHGLAKKKKR